MSINRFEQRQVNFEISLVGYFCLSVIAKRTKSKNRMQITEFLARLGQHERVLREIQEI